MKNTFLSLFFIFFCSYSLVDAQSGYGKLVHLDKPFYVSGEFIWYKIYFPSYYKDQQINIRISVFSNSGKEHQHHYHKTEGKAYTYGYFKIPYDWPTDYYWFSISGSDIESNSAIPIQSLPLAIFNDLEEKASTKVSINPTPLAITPDNPVLSNDSLSMEIDLNASSIHPRDEIQVSIKIRDASGKTIPSNLSVSVRDFELTGPEVFEGQTLHKGKALTPLITRRLDHQISLMGQILDEQGKEKSVGLLGAFSPQDNRFYYSTTNEGGVFRLVLPDFTANKSIQFINFEPQEIDAEMLETADIQELKPLIKSKDIERYLELSRQRKKIYQLFRTTELPFKAEAPLANPQQLLADRVINLADYETFPDLPSFLNEVLFPLKFRKDKAGNWSSQMYNPDPRNRRFHNGNTLFIVDDQLTRDANFVANLDYEQIEKLELFFFEDNLKETFGPMGRTGIARITTKMKRLEIPQNEAKDIIEIQGFQEPYPFPVENTKGLPVFRPQIYWNPELQHNKNGACIFSFKQSDDVSTFVIEVVAQTDQGALITAQKKYKVSWKER